MMRGLALLLLVTSGLIGQPTLARPVSYAGGWTVVEESDRQSSSLLVHYSPASNWSIGSRVEVNRDADYALYSINPTWLAKRWFGSDYQANLYLHAGAGLAASINQNPLEDDFAIQGGVMADWETRSLFVGYRSRYLDAGRFGDQFSHAARLGFAPYVGDTGDLHTWLMLEIDHRPEAKDTVTAAPVIRLFKGPLLLEAGYNLTAKQPLFNFTYRF
jgi:hypothetical protein